MSKFDVFYPVLDECLAFYRNMLEFESNKYNVIVQKDIPKLEAMLKTEQAMIMQSNALERRRIDMQNNLGYDGYTLLEMAERSDGEDCKRLSSYREGLLNALYEIKNINGKSMELIETRLRTSEKRLEISGYIQDMHTYDGTGAVSENNAGINKNLVTKSV